MRGFTANSSAFTPFAGAIVLVISTAIAAVAASALHEVAMGRDEVLAAEAAVSRRDWREAVRHARAGAEARAPGSSWPARAAGVLEALTRSAEERGDTDTALLARDALRASAFATRTGAHADGRPRQDEPPVAAGAPSPSAPSDANLALLGASAVAAFLGLAHMALSRAARPKPALVARLAVAAGIVGYAAGVLMH